MPIALFVKPVSEICNYIVPGMLFTDAAVYVATHASSWNDRFET